MLLNRVVVYLYNKHWISQGGVCQAKWSVARERGKVKSKIAKWTIFLKDKCFQKGPAYFAMLISYKDKMFMKSTPGDNVMKLFTAAYYEFS